MAADDDNGDGTSLFDVFSASPLKNNDEGSLDIYAGLDSAASDSASKSGVPSRNCLDLYEEILTEEGTAKEATYNDLQVEYGKCQQQMKELMKKFKEIQTQNLSLKNENQSLKKNISALIKTARVEINRKDEEISNLHQRLSEFPHFRNNHKSARISSSDAVKAKDFKSRSPHLDDCSKPDHRARSEDYKDGHRTSSDAVKVKDPKSRSPHLDDCSKPDHRARSEDYKDGHRTSSDAVKVKDPKSRSPHLDDCSKPDHRARSEDYKDGHRTSSDAVKAKDPKSRSPLLDDCSKPDHRARSEDYKDGHHSTSLPYPEKEGKSHSEKKNTSYLPTSLDRHCTNGIWSRPHHHCGEGSSNEDNRRVRKDSRHNQYYRGTDRIRKNLSISYDGEPRHPEAIQRLQGRSDKHGKGEPKAESRNSKFKSNTDLDYKSERSSYSWENESLRERSHNRIEFQSDKKLERQSERSPNINRKELNSQDKEERKGDQKPKLVAKDQDPWRRSERASLPLKSKMNSHSLDRYRGEERRGREECKRDRVVSNHSFQDGRSSSSLPSRTHKHIDSKEVDVVHQWEDTPLKTERHRTEDKRKRERESKEENRHMRNEKKMPVEYLPKTNKETQKMTTDLKRQNEPNNDKCEVSNNNISEGLDNKIALKAENGSSDTKNKDLKLSFMEKLNLTLSPAKKQPVSQDNQHKTSDPPKSNNVCSLESSVPAKTELCLNSVSEDITEETKPKLLEPREILPAASMPKIDIPESKMKEDNSLSVKSVKSMVHLELPVGTESSSTAVEMENTGSLFPSSKEMEQTVNGPTAAASVVTDILQTDVSQNCGLELDVNKHDDLNSCVSEGMEMKLIVSTKVTETSESILQPSVEEACVLPVILSKDGNPKFEPSLADDTPLNESKSCHLESCLPKESLKQTDLMEPRGEISETSSMYQDDESSVLSIDFNHMRPIPKAISPLNSPMRPIAKVVRMESPLRVPLCNITHKEEFPPNSTRSVSQSDLNKENQKPFCKADKCEVDSCKDSSLDDLEEGEIRSDNEKSESHKNFEKSANARTSAEVQNTKTSPPSRKNNMSLDRDNRKTSMKVHQTNSKWVKRPSDSTRYSKAEKKDRTVSISSLEKIVQIVTAPSSVPEIMHMLRMIRKHVRKNYMKFKVKFSLRQFHGIIDSASLSFTSLIRHLDLYKISKSVTTLQKKLCDVIESKLKQVKKNGIVDRLFEQQVPDMKKKLWKFVDEQLDYLFAKLKKILMKSWDSNNFGNDSDKGKLDKRSKEIVEYSNCQKGNVQNSNKEMPKEKLPKPGDPVCLKSLLGSEKFEEEYQDQNNTSVNTVKHDTKKSNNCFDNVKNFPPEEHALQLNCPSTPTLGKPEGSASKEAQTSQHATLKPERSFEILTEQQASSLTFNLVSDAQMGEIFKSLLQGSDLLDSSVNCTEKTEWELKTPEKQLLESLKCESIPACTTEELVSEVASPCPKVISDDNWSLLSDKGPPLSSGLSLPVHPDVLDESCMFEVSSNIALGKDTMCSSEKSKACISSILLEDLAVSLTVPSPLKSDGHLSFLKPEGLSNSTPEEVLSAHFSEDALLEEEDASEQDIHLALESDNSSSKSSCSSSWTSRSAAPGFQYHPNLPMHAVIMEKSNDHFIVKIRRAAPCTSPAPQHRVLTDESLASLPSVGKEVEEAVEKEYVSCQDTVTKSVDELENSSKNVHGSNSTPEGQNARTQPQVPDIYDFLKDASCKADGSNEVTDECFKLHHSWEPKVPESIEALPSIEEIPHSVEDHLPNTYIDLTKVPITETKNLGDLIEATVLNIDQLRSSGDNLKQNAHILGNLQSDPVNAFIDLTQDASSESKSESNHSVSAAEGPGCQVICVDEDKCKEERVQVASRPLKCLPEKVYIDLTTESPDSCEPNDDLKSQPASNSDNPELPGTLDNAHKKRKNLCELSQSSQKKQRKETDFSNREKTKKLIQENGEVSQKKASKKRAPIGNKDAPLNASPGIKDSSAELITSTSLSARNIIKKKGEIIVSWTRNDDREILLECQKRGPSLKTFTNLAVKLNKNLNQVSERFQQLMKLFEKSKCR